MKYLFLFVPLFLCCTLALCQQTETDPLAVITAVKKAQASIKTVSYTLERSDTLVTGDTRSMRGNVMIRVDTRDSLLGFQFCARKDGINGESVYSGKMIYETDDDHKSYSLITDPSLFIHVLGHPGGQVLFTDLVRLDTSRAVSFNCRQDGDLFYLTMIYADLKEYDVSKRSKTITINRATMLPMAMRSHQETLGKVQDLYYHITALHINEPAFQYNFEDPGFLKEYTQRVEQPRRSLLNMKGQEAPAFILSSFNNTKVSSTDLHGKVLLLDFWELWCGPCIESMPKVQHLYDTYKSQGLQVYGIINEVKQLELCRQLVQKKEISFTMLTGNEQLKKDYKVNAIPLYVLIGKNGKIRFLSEGYSNELETAIQQALAE